MHTPAGFEMIDGKAHVTSWLAVIFNPSFPYRFTHMMLASGLTVAFLVAGISAYRWLRNERGAEVMASLKTGVYLAAVLIPLQILAGDAHGLNTMEHQPAKLAAMEGIWQTQKGVPAVLFALPDEKTQTNRYEIGIPKLASLYLTHSWDGEVKGLNEFAGKHPPVAPVFWAFRIMVGVGMLMLLVSWASAFQLAPWKKGRSGTLTVWHARVLVAMTFAGWVALIAGWYVTEIGRQPWLVSGVLTAADAASKVAAPRIALTFSLYLTLYLALITAYISVVFYLARHKKHADKPFGTGLEDTPNPVTYPENEGATHA
jgi:cytochrome d ubiquinol oxidase subunit I